MENFQLKLERAHSKVLAKMEEVKQYSDSILTNISESINESDENPIFTMNDLFHSFIDKPLTKGGTDTLMTVDIGTEI